MFRRAGLDFFGVGGSFMNVGNQTPNYPTAILVTFVGRVAQSVQRLARGWTVLGSNPARGEIFLTCPDRPWGPPSLLYNGYRLFTGVKERSGRDADPSPAFSVVVVNGQSQTSAPPMGRTACTEPHMHFTLHLFQSPQSFAYSVRFVSVNPFFLSYVL